MKPITPQEQARLDQARADMINYWQGTPIHDRRTSTPIEPPKPTPIVRVDLRDLDNYCKTHAARVVPGTPWPVIAAPSARCAGATRWIAAGGA